MPSKYLITDEGRECIKCKEFKCWAYFSKNKRSKSGYSSRCKLCDKEAWSNRKLETREYYQKNKRKIIERSQKYHRDNMSTIKERKRIYYQKNKIQILDKQKIYYNENRFKILERSKQWSKKNKHKCISYNEKSRKNNKDKISIKRKEYKLDLVRKMEDAYITGLLTQGCEINRIDIPQELIEAKRAQIKLHRALKEVNT